MKYRFRSIVGLCFLAAFSVARGAADGQAPQPWFERIDFGGDLRLRYEGFDWDGQFDDGRRHRFRFRFRAGFTARLREDVKLGFQVRSGNPDNPHSDNQSFDGGFDKKDIAISQAYLDWKVNEHLAVIGGKFAPKKLWLVSDMQWDDDVVVEGAMERFEWTPGSGRRMKSLEASVYQLILEESGSSGDTYLLGAQVRPTFLVGDGDRITTGVDYHVISNPENVVALTLDGKLDTEPEGIVTNLLDAEGNPISEFRVANVFVVWRTSVVESWPVKVSVFYYKNLGARNVTGSIVEVDNPAPLVVARGSDNDTAWFARVQVGDYKKPGGVAFRYSRYDAEPDAIFYAYVQSDTRRGSNLAGDRFDFRRGLQRGDYVNVTWYRTRWALGPSETMNRWQVDYIFKF